MKRSLLLVLAAVAGLAAAVPAPSRLGAAPSPSAVREASLLRLPPRARAGETVLYGHIASLAHKGSRFELRFDPAWFLTGVAAERAAVEDRVIRPGEAVPNDYYIVEERHRLLTYVVAATARVTVLDKRLRATVIPISELAQVVKGRNPRHRPLFAPGRALGFWIRVGAGYPGAVLSLDQQYQP